MDLPHPPTKLITLRGLQAGHRSLRAEVDNRETDTIEREKEPACAPRPPLHLRLPRTSFGLETTDSPRGGGALRMKLRPKRERAVDAEYEPIPYTPRTIRLGRTPGSHLNEPREASVSTPNEKKVQPPIIYDDEEVETGIAVEVTGDATGVTRYHPSESPPWRHTPIRTVHPHDGPIESAQRDDKTRVVVGTRDTKTGKDASQGGEEESLRFVKRSNTAWGGTGGMVTLPLHRGDLGSPAAETLPSRSVPHAMTRATVHAKRKQKREHFSRLCQFVIASASLSNSQQEERVLTRSTLFTTMPTLDTMQTITMHLQHALSARDVLTAHRVLHRLLQYKMNRSVLGEVHELPPTVHAWMVVSKTNDWVQRAPREWVVDVTNCATLLVLYWKSIIRQAVWEQQQSK